jgi:DHA2 family multidrug resistance protein-like MFS transporter
MLAAFSPSATMLIGARALLGIAGATLTPSTLALIGNMFRDPRQRSLAIGLWLVCFMGGMAIGPLVGGAMLEHFWWGSVFLLGVPVMLVLLLSAPLLLPEYRAPQAGRLDLTSVALSLATILPVIYGLKELAKHGAHALPLVAIVVGAAIGVAFVFRQRGLVARQAVPFLDLRLFANRGFSIALGSMFAITLTGALMMFIAQYLQLVVGLPPFRAGLWMLPAAAASMAGFLLAPLVARRVRPAYLIGAGLGVSVAGALLLTQIGTTSGLPILVAGFVMMNLGSAPLVALSADLVVGSVPPEKAGAAASVLETSSELGFALGIATLGSVGTAVYRSQIDRAVPAGVPIDAVATARDSLAGATAAAGMLPDPLAAALLTAARDAFAGGMHTVAALSAALLLAVAILVLAMLRHLRPIGAAAGAEPHGGAAPGAERPPLRRRRSGGSAQAAVPTGAPWRAGV